MEAREWEEKQANENDRENNWRLKEWRKEKLP